jgi:DNA repair photolyase
MPNNDKNTEYTKGRGAQFNPKNKFESNTYIHEFAEGIDDWEKQAIKTSYLEKDTTEPIAAKVDSFDMPLLWSVNPYQGCEHGCIYCYARPTHEFLGYSAGTDFESKIIVKQNAADSLRQIFSQETWQATTINLSGNTDCYQPAERKYKLTRELLKVCLEYKNPVSITTKNALILRDLDLLQELQKFNLVQVFTSITSTNEKLRLQLEPRTSTYADRFKILDILSSNQIPTGIMNAPIIPGINDTDMHDVLQKAHEVGAQWADYTLVQLNGAVQEIFADWLQKTFPDKASKVLKQIAEINSGQALKQGLSGHGQGQIASIIAQQFSLFHKKFGFQTKPLQLSTHHFVRKQPGQLSLF